VKKLNSAGFNTKLNPDTQIIQVISVLGSRMEKMWRIAANILNKQWGQPTRGGPQGRVLEGELTTPHKKRKQFAECYIEPRAESCEHGKEFLVP
jgi:hypothetical protein